ncbi:hypothetical protein ACWC24_03850 [Streptomyces sp. NPDC001443]
MKWKSPGPPASTALALSAVLLTGCGSPAAKSTPLSATSASASVAAEPVPAKARAAEAVKLAVEDRISADEATFGSGTQSPCAAASPQLFTAKCEAAARATAKAADLALDRIDGRKGFTTLDSVARKLRTAVDTYDRLGCATGPTAADTRHACLGPAAVIAQGFDDLRDGANAALAGR